MLGSACASVSLRCLLMTVLVRAFPFEVVGGF
jgi:hypothetical protein